MITNASDHDITLVDRAVERMQTVTDPHALAQCDIDFHDAVYAAAHHRRLLEAWYAIRSQVHLFLLTRIGVSTKGYVEQMRKEHQELAAALHARDGTLALEMFAAHRRHAFDIVTNGNDTAATNSTTSGT